MPKKQTKQEKANDKRIEQAYYKSCQDVQISVMDIGKVFAYGQKLIAGGPISDETLQVEIRAYVDTIAKNK